MTLIYSGSAGEVFNASIPTSVFARTAHANSSEMLFHHLFRQTTRVILITREVETGGAFDTQKTRARTTFRPCGLSLDGFSTLRGGAYREPRRLKRLWTTFDPRPMRGTMAAPT